jgi:hypothetical protein
VIEQPAFADPGAVGDRGQGERLRALLAQQSLGGVKEGISFHGEIYYTVRTV